MLKKYGALLAAVMLVASLSACLLDPKPPEKQETPPPQTYEFKDLTQKDHVLNNLVAAYVQRDILEYRRIIDPALYQFFFSDGDVSNGLPADGWDKTQDDAATANLLNRNNPNPNRVLSITLDVAQKNLVWIETAADPPLNETWWSVTTTYSFQIRTANDFTYLTNGSPQAQFIVRNVGTDTDPQWRLVRWRDIGNTG